MLVYASEPKSFCSGQVVFQTAYYYTLEEVIFFLQCRDYSLFSFPPGEPYSLIYSEAGEVLTERTGQDRTIPEETVVRMLDVLEHIGAYIEKAFDWIRSLNPKEDKALAAVIGGDGFLRETYELGGIDFGDTKGLSSFWTVWKQPRRGSHHPRSASEGFAITFGCDWGFCFNVKFAYADMLPYEIEMLRYY